MEANPLDRSLERVPRCITCGYVLSGLESRRCPECGREFDPADPRTVSSKPPYVRWWYWTPGVLLAVGIAVILGVALIAMWGYILATVLVLPMCIGILLGFGLRAGWFATIFLGVLALCVLIFALFSTDLAGTFCAASCLGVMFGPTMMGIILGALLRQILKRTQWDQRWHLPALIIMLVPVLVGGIERWVNPHPYAIEEVRTTEDVPVDATRAWKGVMFYEQVKLPPPWLLRFILPPPLYAIGSSDKVGDKKICVYTTGRLVKYITAVSPDHRLDFAVIEQTNVENQSVRLIGGSFAFTPIDAHHTRITLSTRYEPRLSPRWVWRPFETLGMGTLHRFVLKGMARKAEEIPVDSLSAANPAGAGR